MSPLWLATTNSGKVGEIKSLLKNFSTENIFDLSHLPYYSPPKETSSTFEGNALIKARSLSQVKDNVWVLSDDSGLEVEALDGLPGVHSARYAGPKAKDYENVSKLLKMMSFKPSSPRTARFVCVMVLISPSKEEFIFRGEMKGSISPKVKGQNGFGYDPVFIPEGFDKTLAELLPKEKNRISHRSQCLTQVRSHFETL